MGSKSEARIKRKIAKELQRHEKSARLRESPETHVVRTKYASEAPREARAGINPESVFHMKMEWTIDDADKNGSWSWGIDRDWGQDTWNRNLHPKLDEFAKLTWSEIEKQMYGNEGKRHRSHHSMDTEFLCQEAQNRLLELTHDYPDTLFRFRLGNLPRLWGVRVVNKFKVLWYDPTHQVYPVD